MTQQEKDSIHDVLRVYATKYSSQKKAAVSLNGVSAGILSAVINGKYGNISDGVFRNTIAQVIPVATATGWQLVETNSFQEIWYALSNAQEFRKVCWIVGGAECGRTATAAMYAQKNHEVFAIFCDEDMWKGDFVWEAACKLGLKTYGIRIREVLDLAVESIIQTENPLLMFDEGDESNDSVFRYFINLYNRLEGKCGTTFLSTGYIQYRVDCGLNHNRKGYNEIYPRIGHRLFELELTSRNGVFAIYQINNLTGEEQIARVIGSTEKPEFDLWYVKDVIHREKEVAAVKQYKNPLKCRSNGV